MCTAPRQAGLQVQSDANCRDMLWLSSFCITAGWVERPGLCPVPPHRKLKNRNATQVLYVANAEMLTDGGFFSYNEAAGGWDTPQSAQFILHNLLASHKDALGAMRTKDGARSLAEVGRCLHASLQLSDQAPGMLCICSCPVFSHTWKACYQLWCQKEIHVYPHISHCV